MNISLSHAANILSITEDELMFLHQQNMLTASVNQDTLKWQFELDKVLEYKKSQED